jgi:hypothetical protein
MAYTIQGNQILQHSRAEPKTGQRVGAVVTKTIDKSCTDHPDALRCGQDRAKGRKPTLRNVTFTRTHDFTDADAYYTVVDVEDHRLELQAAAGDLDDYHRVDELTRISKMTPREIEIDGRQEVQAKLVEGLWEVLTEDGQKRTLNGASFAAQYKRVTPIPTAPAKPAKATTKKDA